MTGEIRSLLVLGGARSGKSRYAQSVVEQSGKTRIFIATAQPGDGEMAARIATHKAERGPDWRTIEAPLLLDAALRQAAAADTIVLVDCLTLWLSNLMFASCDVAAESLRLTETIRSLPGPAVFVSNEVGTGIVPDNRLARGISRRAGAAQPDRRRGVRHGRACRRRPASDVEAGRPHRTKIVD